MIDVVETTHGELGLEREAVHAVLANAPDGVVVMDGGGIVRFWNAAAAGIFGLTADEALGRRLAELVIPERFREAHTARLAAFEPGQGSTVVNRELRLQGLRADGVEIDLQVKIVPSHGPDGPVFVGFLRDVTAQMDWSGDLIEREHELRDMGERMRALLSSLPFGVLMEDRDRRLLLVNDAMFSIFDVTRADAREIAGRPMNIAARFADIFTDPEAFLARREEVLAAQEPVVDERFVTVDGGVYARDYIPIRVDGEYTGHIWLWRDVSVEAEAQASRERAFESERIARIASEEQLRRVAEMDRLRTEFLAGVSHELRTPLTTVLGYAEILLDDDALLDGQREMVDAIARAGNRLVQLSTDLLLLARLESRSLDLEPEAVDLVDLCRAAVDDARRGVTGAGVEIRTSDASGPPVLGDRLRLRQLVDHLLAAARRLAVHDGRIDVWVQPTEDGWRIDVAIPGTVLSDSARDGLFRPFTKEADDVRVGAGGTRLSLPIARAIAEMHGGSLEIVSDVGTGITVRAMVHGIPTVPEPGP